MSIAGVGTSESACTWPDTRALLALLLVLVSGATGCATASRGSQDCGVSPILVPACGAWWGMYVPAAADGVGLVTAIAEQETGIGRPLDLVERYHDMSTTADGTFPNAAEKELSRNHLLLLSWEPVIWSTGFRYPWGSIASGALDQSVIIPEAGRLRSFGATVFLSFGAEADINADTADRNESSQDSPAQFVAAWRHVHQVFAKLKVRNVVWVWTTTGYLPRAATIAAMYPGRSYVDWVGYDPYNYFSCHHTPWRSFSQTIGPFYSWLVAQKFGKPIMLAEYGTSADPADPGLESIWYRDIVPALHSYPSIKALILWNSATAQCNIMLSSLSTSARAAYRQTGLDPYLRQQLP